VFVPQAAGIFIMLIVIMAFAAAALRQDLALALAGAAFLLPWAYCLAMTLLLALVHGRRARRACIRVSPREIAAGESAEALYREGETAPAAGRIPQLPGILVRCRLALATSDGRRIQHDFNPAGPPPHVFEVRGRGAYFAGCDELAVFDILGFFRFAYRLPAENGARLLASPRPAGEAPAFSARAGDSSLKPEFSFQRTDNLIDHRPYIPGDDPRRINWKLYGHGGGLFVREGEREPPPHSNIAILVDGEYDPLLYDARSARHGVDALCASALAAALACAESGMDVVVGHTAGSQGDASNLQFAAQGFARDLEAARGSPCCGPKEFASALAWPAAMPLPASPRLPAVPEDRGVLILALPRSTAEQSALDRFLKDAVARSGGKAPPVDLLFLCAPADDNFASERLAAAETCVKLYNQRPGVRARVGSGE
jgi:uncharacterized protein (DUF58 family)